MNIHKKYVIIGAGPAGLQMAYFLQKVGLDYLLLDKNDAPGKFYSKYPIHRKLISINKKYNFFEEREFNLRHDWNSLLSDHEDLNFTNYSDELFPDASILQKYLQDFAEKTALNIQYSCDVLKIYKNDSGNFILETSINSTIEANILLVGTGALRQNMPKEIEGIDLTTPYGKVETDPAFYINKRVAILGGGNSAFETANSLANTAAFVHIFLRSPLKMAYETHFVGHLRAKYTNIFDMYQLKSLHAILRPRIKKITQLPQGTLQTQHEYDYPDSKTPGTLKLTREYDYIINCTGFVYTHQNLFADEILPETVMNDKFYKLNECWESSNVSNLYFIGTNMQAIDRKASSGFIHGFRYNIRALSKLLMQKHENIALPESTISLHDFDVFLKAFYERVSIGDGIYQLFGFLGDYMEYNSENQSITWRKELPVAYLKNHLNPDKHVLILTLEFGFDKFPEKSSLEFMGPSDPHDTENSAFLHPVVRYYYQGNCEAFHFGDSLLGRWDMPHAEGGAIASYHTEFYNWLANIFNIPSKDVSNLGENPNFEKWNGF